MKNKMFLKKSVMVATLFVGFLMTSCVNDLNVTPIDPNVTTSASVYNDPAAYKQGLAKLYAAFALSGQQGPAGQPDIAGIDEGFGLYLRSLWYVQEFTTDEALWSYEGDANGTIFNLHYQTWVPTDLIPAALFARITNAVALCNEFIRNTAGAGDTNLKQFNAEARFLRALAYYHGLDIFGTMPFVTEADKPSAFLPKPISRADLFAYLETELKAIQSDLGPAKFEYGRADKAAASMLLAKLYLNAEVYLGAGKGRYTDALTEINKVIASSYTLAPKYLNNFLADNNTSPEIIFSFNYDADLTQAYSMVQVMIAGNAGNGGWSGLRTTSQFVGKFTNDGRGIFAKEDKGQSLTIDAVNQTKQGYGIYKFRNVKSDGTPGKTNNAGMVDTDFPYFRLADAYLMYAEAVVRGGTGGDQATALNYVNKLRSRTGDPAIAPVTGSLTLDFILDERARELYWEGHRRTDLIRFGKFTGSSYLWDWKGKVKSGSCTESFRDLFPIPSTELGANPNLKQNTGY